MGQGNEASVEEILESIKKVIARDNREDAMELRRRRETEGVVDSGSDGRHADMIRSHTAADTSSDEDADESEAEEVLDLAEMEFAEDLDPPTSSEDDNDDNDGDSDEGDDSPLTNEAVASSMRENFAALALLAEPGAQPQIVRSGETSLEGLVRDMLRPMLSEWLDKNLPGMVEKMVQAEIARIAGKRG